MKEDATLWWEGAVKGVNLETLTWEDFKRTLFAKYFTEDVRSQMIIDFMSLRQGDRSVVEYIQQFERGCHFVPLIAGDEREKKWQFIDGLREDIKQDVRMLDVATYEAAVDRQQVKKTYTGPSKGPNQQKPQQRPQGQQAPQQQQRGTAPNTGEVPMCPKCQKPHSGQCLSGSNVCFYCKEQGHISINCPKNKNTTGRVFVMQAEEADPYTSLITRRIIVGGNSTFVFLDSGATHSFISLEFIRRIGIIPGVVTTGYDVTMTSGQILTTYSVVRGLELELQGHSIRADLVVLSMTGFDLILGMDWLTVNGASIDFRRRTVSVKPPEGESFIFFASQSSSASHVISFVHERKLLRGVARGFLPVLSQRQNLLADHYQR
ncbi:uncharacterized protein [Henckelia pumila]|uniref:uncharacterized protein n=1 Tax=Henckelia pumila TaxID=405737 RepID=UPI003C6DD27D